MFRNRALIVAFAVTAISATVSPCRADTVLERDRIEAAKSYDRALVLFDQKQARAALAEFERAYQLSPAFKIQYNIAVVNLALDDPAAALRAFERYLAEGGDHTDSLHHDEVLRQVDALSHKAGALSVEVDVQGATVLVDETEVGKSPIAKLWLNPGRHRVNVRSADGRSQFQAIDVAAGDERKLRFSLKDRHPIAPTGPRRVQENAAPARPLPWLAYGITAAVGVSAAVTGGLALAARSNEREVQGRLTTVQETVNARHKVEHLALTTDLLLAGTVISGGVALYLTLRAPRQRSQTSFVIGPGRISVLGAF